MSIAAMTLLLAATVAGTTEVATWTDAEGVLHFSDRPPALEYERVKIRPANGADPFPVVEQEVTHAVRQPVETPVVADLVDDHAEACFKARLNLETLMNRRRTGYRLTEARSLDEQERRYRAQMRFYCR